MFLPFSEALSVPAVLYTVMAVLRVRILFAVSAARKEVRPFARTYRGAVSAATDNAAIIAPLPLASVCNLGTKE